MAKFDEEEYLKRIQREINEEAAREKLGRMDDDAADREFAELLGMDLKDFQAAIDANIPEVTEADVRAAQRYIAQGKKELKRGRHKKAAQAFNKDVVKRVHKASKKGKGCAVVALMFLGSAVTSTWGVVEGIKWLV